MTEESRLPPKGMDRERLETLLKMAKEKDCYLEWYDAEERARVPSVLTMDSVSAAPEAPSSSSFCPEGDLGKGLSSSSPPPGDLGRWGKDCAYPFELSPARDGDWGGPKPERVQDAKLDSAENFADKAQAAFDNGVWQTDASHHARHKVVDPESLKGGTTVLLAKSRMTTLRVAYFFSGIQKKASIAEQLMARCEKEDIGRAEDTVEALQEELATLEAEASTSLLLCSQP